MTTPAANSEGFPMTAPQSLVAASAKAERGAARGRWDWVVVELATSKLARLPVQGPVWPASGYLAGYWRTDQDGVPVLWVVHPQSPGCGLCDLPLRRDEYAVVLQLVAFKPRDSGSGHVEIEIAIGDARWPSSREET